MKGITELHMVIIMTVRILKKIHRFHYHRLQETTI